MAFAFHHADRLACRQPHPLRQEAKTMVDKGGRPSAGCSLSTYRRDRWRKGAFSQRQVVELTWN